MKIGRNAPCPCGSGKKYKFCCLKKDNDMKNGEVTEKEFEYCIIFNDSINDCDMPYNGNDVLLYKFYNIIWYIMHLPRSVYDYLQINQRTESIDRINSHNIIFVPCSRINDYYNYNFTLVIAELDCIEKAKLFLKNNKSEIGLTLTDELSSNLLRQQWNEIKNRTFINSNKYYLDISVDTIELFEKNNRLGLTLFFMNNWLNSLKDLKTNLLTYLANYFTEILRLRNNIILYKYIVLNNISVSSLDKTFNSLCPYIKIPITLSLYDIGVSHQKEESIELVGIHNAISNNGAFIKKQIDLSRIYSEIRGIENSLKEAASGNIGVPKSYSIWKSLKVIGKILYESFSEEELVALERASQIVVFSNFPFGLAILPNHSAPLCCYKRIAYRHLEPFTSMIITEMSGHIIQDMTKGLKILMLECIDKSDHIRSASDEKLKAPLLNLHNSSKDLNFIYKEVLTVADFYKCINESGDIDILLISAHGFYDNNKYSGIYIGEEKLLNINGISNRPKLVMFSACHVCPRGNNAYSIVEQMIQEGILAVLGTNVPVDVHRNANLFLRFIIAILSTQKGENPFNNILDIWQHIVSSNAVCEIRESNQRVKHWLDTKGILIDFQCTANEKGIRYTDVYEDTLDILVDMAEDDKLKASLIDIKIQKNYFPESIFYELNGFPENIIVGKEYNLLKDMYKTLHL